MIKGFWKKTHFYCIHGHDEPIPMVVMEGSSPFYACPKYMRQDEKHPDGYIDGERACANRISFTRAMSVMERFMKIVEEDDAAGVICDYTGMKFSFDGIDIRILKYDPKKEIRVGVINRRAIHS